MKLIQSLSLAGLLLASIAAPLGAAAQDRSVGYPNRPVRFIILFTPGQATDIIGGHIDVGVETMAAALPHIKNGRLKVLANLADKRSPNFPDVATVSEQFPGTATSASSLSKDELKTRSLKEIAEFNASPVVFRWNKFDPGVG